MYYRDKAKTPELNLKRFISNKQNILKFLASESNKTSTKELKNKTKNEVKKSEVYFSQQYIKKGLDFEKEIRQSVKTKDIDKFKKRSYEEEVIEDQPLNSQFLFQNLNIKVNE